MGQTLCFIRDKAKGKHQVKRICDKVFDECTEKNHLLSLDKLHIATLMVYNSVNKQLLSPHKEPPSPDTVRAKAEALRLLGSQGLEKSQFFDLIAEWINRDLRLVLANRVMLALLAAPLLAIKTKSAAMNVKRIQNVAEKVPTPLIISAYTLGLVLLQDSRVK